MTNSSERAAVLLVATSMQIVSRKSRRKFIPSNETPPLALTWSTNKKKAGALRSWRLAVGSAFAEHGRCLRVAWALEWLFGEQGYAYPTDAFLSRELGLPVKKIQDALQNLEKGGAIIRKSVFVENRAQRRIWPSAEKIPPHDGE